MALAVFGGLEKRLITYEMRIKKILQRKTWKRFRKYAIDDADRNGIMAVDSERLWAVSTRAQSSMRKGSFKKSRI